MKKLEAQDFLALHHKIRALERHLGETPGAVSKLTVDPRWHRLWRGSEVSLLIGLNAPEGLSTGRGDADQVIPGIPIRPPE